MLLTLSQICDIKNNLFDLGPVCSIDSNLSECFFPKNSNSSGQLGLCGECNIKYQSSFRMFYSNLDFLKFGHFKVSTF